MSDPYYPPHQTYSSAADNNPAIYAPSNPDQDPSYNYETLPPHQEQGYQSTYGQPQYAYAAHPSQNQSYTHLPTVYHPHPQIPEPQHEYLSPAPAMPGAETYTHGHDETLLSPHYEPRAHRGSNAEYYEPAGLQEISRPSTRNESSSVTREREDDGDTSGGERGLGGALVGGATGYYLGHKKSHGLLGAVGGALLGSFLENKIEKRRDEEHGSQHGHHGRRRTRHHRHHGSRSRSRSRHSHYSSGSYSG